jgi:hypothetical protein
MFNAVPAQTSLPLQHNRANPRISCAKKRRDDISFGGIQCRVQEAYKDFEVQMCGIQYTLNSYVWSRFVYNTYSMYYRYKPVLCLITLCRLQRLFSVESEIVPEN